MLVTAAASASQMTTANSIMTAFLKRARYTALKDPDQLPGLMRAPLIPALTAQVSRRLICDLIWWNALEALRTALQCGLLRNMHFSDTQKAALVNFAIANGTDFAFAELVSHGLFESWDDGFRVTVGLCLDIDAGSKLVWLATLCPAVRTRLFNRQSLLGASFAHLPGDSPRHLLGVGCDPNGVRGQAEAPIMTAIREGHSLELLIERGVDVTQAHTTMHGKMTPLRFLLAMDNGMMRTEANVLALTLAGANVFQCGHTPCICSADDMHAEHKPTRIAIRETKRRMCRAAGDVAIGLSSLNLPVLCLVELGTWLKPADLRDPIAMHVRWQIAALVQKTRARVSSSVKSTVH